MRCRCTRVPLPHRPAALLPHRTLATNRFLASSAPVPPTLHIRRIGDSFLQCPLRIASDPLVRASYIDHAGALSIPRLLEDLDAVAGRVAYSHCGAPDAMGAIDDVLACIRQRHPLPLAESLDKYQPERNGEAISAPNTPTQPSFPPIMIVTASVDRLDLHRMPSVDNDAELVGKVTFVGTSSMEIEVSLRELVAETSALPLPPPYLSARFTMVARDRALKCAVQVNPLVLETPEEQRLFSRGQELKTRKRISAETALEKQPPTADERLIIHDLWIMSNAPATLANTNTVAMERTAIESVLTMQPQDRNMHNFIFGGYLMRIATELAITAGRLFVGAGRSSGNAPLGTPAPSREPYFLGMDDINFRKPVPIGAVLVLRACVTYCAKRTFLVRVTAEVIAKPCDSGADATAVARETTNVFHVLLGTSPGTQDAFELPTLLPRTYAESMLYLDGKRRWESAKAASKELNSLLYTSWA